MAGCSNVSAVKCHFKFALETYYKILQEVGEMQGILWFRELREIVLVMDLK